MTLEKSHELIAMHSGLGGGYNRNPARMVLGEVMQNHRQQVVDDFIREYELEAQREIQPSIKFESVFKS